VIVEENLKDLVLDWRSTKMLIRLVRRVMTSAQTAANLPHALPDKTVVVQEVYGT